MRWHILGAGNMGALAALYLERAGHDIIVIHPSRNHIERQLYLPTGESLSLQWRCITPGAAEGVRFLLVATKAPRTRDALAPLIPRLAAGATLVRLQNGMGTLAGLQLPWHLNVVEAISFSGSWRNGDQQHLVAENATLMGNGTAVAPDWFDGLRGHWPHLRWEADIELHQLMKLAINAVINPLTALHDCDNGALADEPSLAREATELAREVDTILRALRPDWPGHTAERSLGVARDTAANTSSMRSDFRRGDDTEIDFINGWLVQRADDLGVAAPLNKDVRERIRHHVA